MKQGIILAAGLGSRLRNITKNTPKSLIQINKKPIIEKNIEYMIEAGVDRIIVVIGYMREKFEYLEKKYENANLVLVYNEDFDSSNTVSSMFCAKKYLDCETYITTADILLRENLFKKYYAPYSFYLLRPSTTYPKPDWIAQLDYNDNNRFISVDKKALVGHAYTGISHWSVDELKFIKEQLEKINWSNENERKQYWDELLLPHFEKIKIYANILDNNSEIYEFDDFSDIELLLNEQDITIDF